MTNDNDTYKGKTVLWWGRFNRGYSRNRILQQILREQGWTVTEFMPTLSSVGDLEAVFKRLPIPDLFWVPCFRQRDFSAALRCAMNFGVPLLFDPLISAYDKQVFENRKLKEKSFRAEHLRRREGRMFKAADVVLADTDVHADFFVDTLGARRSSVFTVPVGAEDELFLPQKIRDVPGIPVEVLFYGSFVPLQGVDVIVEAARKVPEVNWTLLGQGKLRERCERNASGLENIRFEDWIPYDQLANRIGRADILLGIFGETPKASRVIPNKFYQSIACSRPIITSDSPVYAENVRRHDGGGVEWVPAGDAIALANMVRTWAASPELLARRSQSAREIYDSYYSKKTVTMALLRALKSLSFD